jgi:uncharacterized protein YcbX
LRIYPFKSLDGYDVEAATVVARGGLARDRAFVLVDDDGIVNAKREPLVHRLRVTYDAAATHATFASELRDESATVSLEDPSDVLPLLARHFGRAIRFERDDAGGFPDDPKAPGPTIVSVATLAAVASWFDHLDAEDVRLRLRANIELDGVPAFWEDVLFGPPETTRAFRIGEALLAGTNPCARCIVPSRDARSGEPLPTFQKQVAQQRAATLPAWSDRSRFDHFYRLCVNTRAEAAAGATIRVGDVLALVDEPSAVR